MTFKEKSKTFITSETYSQVNLRNRKPENLSTVQWKEEKNWVIVFHFPPQSSRLYHSLYIKLENH